MADFSQEQLLIIAKSLEDYYQKCSLGYRPGDEHGLPNPADVLVLRGLVSSLYANGIGDKAQIHSQGSAITYGKLSKGEPEPKLCLVVGQRYRVVEQGHVLDGHSVVLERIETQLNKGTIRTWVTAGSLDVREVRPSSLRTSP